MSDKQKVIDKLTPEQEKELEVWRDRWFKIGCSTELANRPRAETAISKLYEFVGESKPEFIWVNSPKEACEFVAKNSDKKVNPQDVIYQAWWGQQDAYWIAFYKFCQDVLGVKYNKKESEQLEMWSEIAQSCGWWFPYQGVCVVCERPEVIAWEANGDRPRLHSTVGPAVKFRDGVALYCIHGINVDGRYIENPKSLTVKEIDSQGNVEVKRVLMDLYGKDRYLFDSGAKLLDEDKDELGFPRRLYRTEIENDEALVMVGLTNSTPEPDGTHKAYMLRVPPETTTALQAAAWLGWEDDPKNYKLKIQT